MLLTNVFCISHEQCLTHYSDLTAAADAETLLYVLSFNIITWRYLPKTVVNTWYSFPGVKHGRRDMSINPQRYPGAGKIHNGCQNQLDTTMSDSVMGSTTITLIQIIFLKTIYTFKQTFQPYTRICFPKNAHSPPHYNILLLILLIYPQEIWYPSS